MTQEISTMTDEQLRSRLDKEASNYYTGKLGATMNRIRINNGDSSEIPIGEFMAIEQDPETGENVHKKLGASFDGVVILESFWYSYYDSQNNYYPVRSNNLRSIFDDEAFLFGRSNKNDEESVIYCGDTNGMREYLKQHYPDQRRTMEYGQPKSFVTCSPMIYVYIPDFEKVYRMKMTWPSYGMKNANNGYTANPGTFTNMKDEVHGKIIEHFANFTVQSIQGQGNTVYRPMVNAGEAITNVDTLRSILSVKENTENLVFTKERDKIKQQSTPPLDSGNNTANHIPEKSSATPQSTNQEQPKQAQSPRADDPDTIDLNNLPWE